MKLTIEINLDNAAFGDDGYSRAEESMRVLERWERNAHGLHPGDEIPLRDNNGNQVGTAKVTA